MVTKDDALSKTMVQLRTKKIVIICIDNPTLTDLKFEPESVSNTSSCSNDYPIVEVKEMRIG